MKKIVLLLVLLIVGCNNVNIDNSHQSSNNSGVNNELNLDNKQENLDENRIICKRATELHSEKCERTDKNYYCSASGYTNKTIIYGSLGVTGVLSSGDAFDCDVNGDNIYDSLTERFYYVTDLESDNNYAVLIYYSNTTNGVANNEKTSLTSYDFSNEKIFGPRIGVKNLPTKSQWNNVSLSKTIRYIEDSEVEGYGVDFSYDGYAARMLTVYELNKACGIKYGEQNNGELDNCNYFLENTKFVTKNNGTHGFWLETPYDFYYVWNVFAQFRMDALYSPTYDKYVGIRPVIEVLKNNIEY